MASVGSRHLPAASASWRTSSRTRATRVSALARARRAGVEAGEVRADTPHQRRPTPGAGDMRRERVLLAEPPHFDHVLDRVRVTLIHEREPGCRGGDRPDAEVDARSERPVQPDLLVAEEATTLERPVVDEGQHELLLEFVRAVSTRKTCEMCVSLCSTRTPSP